LKHLASERLQGRQKIGLLTADSFRIAWIIRQTPLDSDIVVTRRSIPCCRAVSVRKALSLEFPIRKPEKLISQA